MKEQIDIAQYVGTHNPQYVKFVITIGIQGKNVYKEDIHQLILDSKDQLSPNYKENYVFQTFMHIQRQNDTEIVLQRDKKNLLDSCYFAAVTISDNKVLLEYAEKGGNEPLFPNLRNLHVLELCVLRALSELTNSFADCKLLVNNKVETNHYCQYCPNKSLFEVGTENYYVVNQVDKTSSEIEGDTAIYETLRRFFQLFKCEKCADQPYIRLVESQFSAVYSEMWK